MLTFRGSVPIFDRWHIRSANFLCALISLRSTPDDQISYLVFFQRAIDNVPLMINETFVRPLADTLEERLIKDLGVGLSKQTG